jgi:hypothetical protein
MSKYTIKYKEPATKKWICLIREFGAKAGVEGRERAAAYARELAHGGSYAVELWPAESITAARRQTNEQAAN